MPHRAIALLSGGLDSILAARLVQEQGVEVIGLHFASLMYRKPELKRKHPSVKQVAEQLGIELISEPKGVEFFHMIQHPLHGYGSAINPCIDCRIFYLRKARALMAERGASFIVSGEVLGQRPKSQKRDGLRTVEREACVEGILLRPLCAKHMAPTVPETEGIVDRERLFDITGRGRGVQYALAEKFGLTAFSSPGGGCPLTEKFFAPKVLDMFQYVTAYDENDIALLGVRRLFRLSPETRIFLSQDEDEGAFLRTMRKPSDALLEPGEFAGPVALVRGVVDQTALSTAAGLVRFYSKLRDRDVQVPVSTLTGETVMMPAPRLAESHVAAIKIEEKDA